MRKTMPKATYLLLFFLFLLFLLSFRADAADIPEKTSTSSDVIRVAFPMQEGLTEKDEQGNYSGYTYDYLQEIAQYTGWEYEFVEVPGTLDESLSTMLDMMEKGEIDIMGGMNKIEQTEKLFDFPEYGYGFTYMTLTVPADTSQINENNLQNLKKLRIAAFARGRVAKSKAENFCKLNNIPFEFVDCESEEAIINMIRIDQADAMLGNDLSPVDGFRTIAQFDGSQFYFATTKGRTDLLSALNSTILTIQQVKPYFESSLHEKYFSNRSYQTYLTDEETQYVESAEPLKIAIPANFEPVQYLNAEGNITGITKDILDRVEKETGLKIDYLPVDTFTDAYAMLEDGEADAVCGIPYSYDNAQKHNLVMSNALLTAQLVMVTKSQKIEDTAGKTAAIVNSVVLEDDTSGLNIKAYNSVEAGMKAIVSGKADFSYINLYSAEYMSHYAAFKDLRLIPQTGKSLDYCLGIKKPVDTMLISLINKVLSNIPPEDLETIIYQNTSGVIEPVTFRSFVEQNPFLCIGIVSILFLVIALVVMCIARFHIKANKRLNIETERYLQLSEFSNEYIYEYDFTKDSFSFSKNFAELFHLSDKIDAFSKAHLSIPSLSGTNAKIFQFSNQPDSADANTDSDYLCRLPDGSRRWFRNTVARIKDETGKAVYLIGKLTDIQHEQEEKAKLKQQALIDGLTEVYNSDYTKTLITERIANQQGYSALLIMDIDKFKDVNDLLGHYTGDIVLRDFAHLLYSMGNPGDITGRIGGDEFMFFLEDVQSQKQVDELCATFCTKARKTYSTEDGKTLTVTTSIGALLFDQSCPFEELYQAVDKLLYEAKKNGRNGYVLRKYS